MNINQLKNIFADRPIDYMYVKFHFKNGSYIELPNEDFKICSMEYHDILKFIYTAFNGRKYIEYIRVNDIYRIEYIMKPQNNKKEDNIL